MAAGVEIFSMNGLCLPQSTESSLKKKLKKKTKGDSAWLRPSRKRKRRIKSRGDSCSCHTHTCRESPTPFSCGPYVDHWVETASVYVFLWHAWIWRQTLKHFLTIHCCSTQNLRQRFSLRLQLKLMQATGKSTRRFSVSLSTSTSPKSPRIPLRTEVSVEELKKLILTT